jgi:tRNA (cmo5U34)-methyltransferase
MMVAMLPPQPRRVLDLGCGDGRLSALVLDQRPCVEYVLAVDRSEAMLALARERFAAETRAEVKVWDMNDSIDSLRSFDLVVSGFAIHHLEHERKRHRGCS